MQRSRSRRPTGAGIMYQVRLPDVFSCEPMSSERVDASDLGARMAKSLVRGYLIGAFYGSRAMVLLPIPIGIAMFVFAPSYTGALVRSAVGFVVLLLAVVVMACGYALTEIAIRMWHKGRVGVGALVAVASLVFCAFPALWLVLLGPALVILIQKPQ